MSVIAVGDLVRWTRSPGFKKETYRGRVVKITPTGMLRVEFYVREGCPPDGKLIFGRTLAKAWVTKIDAKGAAKDG